jgi:hypothetical protein
MRGLGIFDNRLRKERKAPPLHLTVKEFMKDAHDTLDRNLLWATCPNCRRYVLLVLDGFGDYDVGVVCTACGGCLHIDRKKRQIFQDKPFYTNRTYRDCLRERLKVKGVDWKTGWLLPSSGVSNAS